jgi:hypothetical protein
MQVNYGLFQILMTEQDLNGAEIGASLEQMSCEAVAQGIVVLLMIRTYQRSATVIILAMVLRLRSSAFCEGRAPLSSW